MPRSRPAIDSELAAALQAMPIGPNGVFDLTDIPATRQAVRALAETIAGTIPDEHTVTAHEIQAPRADAPDVPILLLRPQNAPGPLPVIVWFRSAGSPRAGQALRTGRREDPRRGGARPPLPHPQHPPRRRHRDHAHAFRTERPPRSSATSPSWSFPAFRRP